MDSIAEPKRLFIVNNRHEADYYINILKDNGIPAFIKEHGLGSLYQSYLGLFGKSGIEIFVPAAAYDAACGILGKTGDGSLS